MAKKPLKTYRLTITAICGSEFQEEFVHGLLTSIAKAVDSLEIYHKKNKIITEIEEGITFPEKKSIGKNLL